MARFRGVKLDKKAGTVSYRPGMRTETFPVAGVEAWVETSGQVDRRLSLTRTGVGALALGPLGAILGGLSKKKIDQTDAFLLVRGPEFGWVVDVAPKEASRKRRSQLLKKAHRFGLQVTSAGTQTAVQLPPPTVQPSWPPPPAMHPPSQPAPSYPPPAV